jgi:hypothetical protein
MGEDEKPQVKRRESAYFTNAELPRLFPSRRLCVLTDEAAEQVAALDDRHRSRGGRCRCTVGDVRRAEVERAVGSVVVVVRDVDAQDVLELAPAEDEQAVEAVVSDCAHPAFGVGVCVRRVDRRADDRRPVAAEDVVEAAAELAVAVVDEEFGVRTPVLCHAGLRLRACWVTQLPLGLPVRAMCSILRRSSEMKKST